MSKRRHKHEEHEEHVNHERWLVTYADMITLLMVLFIVLFAMGQTDLAKYKKLKQSLSEGFGGPDQLALLDGGTGINQGGAASSGITPHDIAAEAALAAQDKRVIAWQVEKKKLEKAAADLQQALSGSAVADGTTADPVINDPQISVSLQARGLIITINSDAVLFAPGSATLRPEGQEILRRIAPQLVRLDNTIIVEGHTDNLPISGTYPSNWELSTARASSVLRSFVERYGLPAVRGAASGYADQRPITSNSTTDGRAKNRRVEIVVQAVVTDPGVAVSDTPQADVATDAAPLIDLSREVAVPSNTVRPLAQPSTVPPTNTEPDQPGASEPDPLVVETAPATTPALTSATTPAAP